MILDEQSSRFVKVRLLAKRENDYTAYVFEDLDFEGSGCKYIMCTKCPNWNSDEIKLYQEGFLQYKPVNAGIDKWYDPKSMTYQPYRYSANYFMSFVPLTHVVDGNRIIKSEELTLV